MKIDTLDELKTAFAEWRSTKKYRQEPMPKELLARARLAARKHGVKSVVGVTQVERTRLFRSPTGRRKQVTQKTKHQEAPAGTFSRLDLSAPSGRASRSRPIAEVETGTGVTLRMYEQTPEVLGMFSAACNLGGVR